MRIGVVIDANVLFRILISGGDILDIFYDERLEIFAPLRLKEEFLKHKDEISEKSKLTKKEFDELYLDMFEKIKFIEVDEYKECLKKAKEILQGHEKDEDFIAICLLRGIKLWTYEKLFFEKNYAISTKQIGNFLREIF